MKKYGATIVFDCYNGRYTEDIFFEALNKKDARKRAKGRARALACQYGEDFFYIEEIWEIE